MFINKKATTQTKTKKTLTYRHDGEKESEVRKMWVSRRSWDCLLYRIKKCEDDIKIQKENTENLIRNTAKKFLNNQKSCAKKFRGLNVSKNISMSL